MEMMILKVGLDINQFRKWNEYFLHKVLEKIIPTLKKGGKMMEINILKKMFTLQKKGGGGKDWKEITQPMCEFLESKD